MKTLPALAAEGRLAYSQMILSVVLNDTYHDLRPQIYEANMKWLEINLKIRNGEYQK